MHYSIDAHQHYWHYKSADFPWIRENMKLLKRDFSPQNLKPLLDQHGLLGSITVQAQHSEFETDWLIKQVTSSSGVNGVVGWLDVRSPELENKLLRFSECKVLKGLRHQIQDEVDPSGWMENIKVEKGIKIVQKHEYVWDLLIKYQHFPEALEFSKRHDNWWIVLNHCGKPDISRGAKFWLDQIRPIAALPHVFCKLSGLVTESPNYHWQSHTILEFIEAALTAFGSERLMFGSDWPVCLLAAQYSEVYSLVKRGLAGLSSSEQAAIFGGNAMRIYGLIGA